jgi:molybdate transport system substrate-binding protein
VFAAASLKESLDAATNEWSARSGQKVLVSYAASNALARQIEQGAPADVYISADEKWMDYLAKANAIVPETRKDLLSNALVLIVPKDRALTVTIGPNLDLNALLGPDGRVATGDPAHVPVGIYAKQALTKLGLWSKVEPRLARAEDVRGALLLVERGEAPAGIVYATDAAVAPGVVIAGTFPENSHDRITYPFAVVRTGDTPEARALMAYLAGPDARAIFVRRGFVPD